MSLAQAEFILAYPAPLPASLWYEALAVVLAERSPA